MPGPELYRQSPNEPALVTLPQLSKAKGSGAQKSQDWPEVTLRACGGDPDAGGRGGARGSPGSRGRDAGGAEGAGCAVAADGHLKWPRGVRGGFPGLGVIRVAPEVGPAFGSRGAET